MVNLREDGRESGSGVVETASTVAAPQLRSDLSMDPSYAASRAEAEAGPTRSQKTAPRTHLGHTLDLGRLVRVVVVDRKRKLERAALVHSCSTEGTPQVSGESWRARERSAPSSGVMVSSKLRRSSALGKWVFIVGGRSSSVKSAWESERTR